MLNVSIMPLRQDICGLPLSSSSMCFMSMWSHVSVMALFQGIRGLPSVYLVAASVSA
jgi:hypothetical protein